MALYPNFKDETIAAREREAGYITYKTLADYVGDMILCNAMRYRDMALESGDYMYYEDSNGTRMSVEEYEDELSNLRELDDPTEEEEERIKELENLHIEYSEADIFQWYIISDDGYEFLWRFAPEELVYHDEELDVYVWAITHYGTNWGYVFTDIPVRKEDE